VHSDAKREKFRTFEEVCDSSYVMCKDKLRFILNNQQDALIIQILFCYKTLYVLGIFSAHHQEFSTVHSALVSFMQVFDDRLEAVIKNLHETPDYGQRRCPKHVQFYNRIKFG